VDIIKTEIGQLEKTVNALAFRPRLIRREYWIAQVESLLERPGISAADRQRLCTILDLLRNVSAERFERFATASDDEHNSSLEVAS
jgi:hypothetical protein